MASFQIAGALPGRLEHDVAARDEGFGAAKAGGLEQRAQAIHLHDVATDVDGPQEGGVLHGVRRNRPTSTPLPRYMTGHRRHHRRARLRWRRADRRHVDRAVQREELEDVVMRRSGGRRARASKVRTAGADLARAVRQLRTLGDAFRQIRVAAGMFHSIQCRMSSVPLPVAASTSCTSRTKLAAPSGTLLHASGGDT